MIIYTYIPLSGEQKILTFTMDSDTGELTPVRDIAIAGGPSALAVDPESRFLYASLRSSSEIASFRIDRSSGDLSLLGKVSVENDACYLTADRRGRFLLAACYSAGKPLWQIPLRFEPGPRQHRLLLNRRHDGKTDFHRAAAYGKETQGLQHRSHGQLPLRGRSGYRQACGLPN